MINDSLIFLRYNAKYGETVAAAERSMTQFRRFERVPELVALDADGGRIAWSLSWFEILIFDAVENDGRRMPEPSCIPSDSCTSMFTEIADCPLSALGDALSACVGAVDWFVMALSRVAIALAEASTVGAVAAFLRVLKENFFGGLKVLRTFWSFSERLLTACYCQSGFVGDLLRS